MQAENNPFLPKENLPDCWNDEERINVLFAPFRNRAVNSQDWDSKLTFWKNLICTYCTVNRVYAFKTGDLSKAFNRDGRSPSCLQIVVQEMLKNCEIKPIDNFLQRPSETWGLWAAETFVKRPMFWSYSKLKNSIVSPNIADAEYVHLLAVQNGAESLLKQIPDDYKNKVVHIKELIDVTGWEQSKLASLKLVLHCLVIQGKVDIKELKTETNSEIPFQNVLIKFGDMKKVKPISEMDVSVHILQQNEEALMKNVEKLEIDISAAVSDAKSYLLKNHRQMAKSCLRKKREIEKQITKRANALQNVQILLSKIQDADQDTEVLESYKMALASLRKTFKEGGLTEDAAVDTMVDLSEVLEIHEDIQSTFAQPLTPYDGDLEEELAELIAEDNNSPAPKSPPPTNKGTSKSDDLEKRFKDLGLPDVPDTSPETSRAKITL